MQKHINGSLPHPESQACIHHWIIDVKNAGICKKCGDTHQFCNSWEQASRGNTWTRNSGNTRNDTSDAG